MTSLITDVFPVEVWEKIIYNCDGKTLKTLCCTSVTFGSIINTLEKNFHIWRTVCHEELSKHELADIRQILCQTEPLWKYVYDVWCKWSNLQEWQLNIIKTPKSYTIVSDVKVSGVMIVVSDKAGFTIFNPFTDERKRYKIGPVKRLELYRTSQVRCPKRNNFKHDVLDCTVESNFHFFFEVHRSLHLNRDKYENQLIRYCFSGEKLILPTGVTSEPVIEADIYYDKMLIITRTAIKQVTDSTIVLFKLDYNWDGARCWFLWHARLIFCAKDETLDIFLENFQTTVLFGGFPRVSAIFYFTNLLFLGSVDGSLYIYRINADDILELNLQKYMKRIDVCYSAISAINIIEVASIKNTSIVVATESRIYHLLPSDATFIDDLKLINRSSASFEASSDVLTVSK